MFYTCGIKCNYAPTTHHVRPSPRRADRASRGPRVHACARAWALAHVHADVTGWSRVRYRARDKRFRVLF